MTPGHRVRVLVEIYDPNMHAVQAEQWAQAASRLLRDNLPGATIVVYVEPNPPADEL